MTGPPGAKETTMSDPADGVTDREDWPDLPLAAWQDTYATLHMWTQIVGKVRLALSPPVNHFWQVALYVNDKGLTTSPMQCHNGVIEIQFDFAHHNLMIQMSDGSKQVV